VQYVAQGILQGTPRLGRTAKWYINWLSYRHMSVNAPWIQNSNSKSIQGAARPPNSPPEPQRSSPHSPATVEQPPPQPPVPSPHEKSSIVNTPQGTAVIDYFHKQPPPGVDVGPQAPSQPPKGTQQLPPGTVKTPWGTIEQVTPINKVSDVATPPPGVATSSGPASGRSSVIRTPQGTAVIDYFHKQPPPGVDVGPQAPSQPPKGTQQLPPGTVKTPWGTIEQVTPINKVSDVATPPPGVATSSGPASGRSSVIRTPQGTAVIDYASELSEAFVPQAARPPHSKRRLPIEIETTLYIPHILGEWNEEGKALKPKIETALHIPPFLEGSDVVGGLIEHEASKERESRGRRSLLV